jgi:hypothetical protein
LLWLAVPAGTAGVLQQSCKRPKLADMTTCPSFPAPGFVPAGGQPAL